MLIMPAKTLFLARRPALVAAAGITFIAAATPASVTNGGTATVDLTTIAGLAQDDIVLGFCFSTGGTRANPSGWTEIQSDTNVGAGSGQVQCSYKIMGASPDTSVSFWDSGTTADSTAALAFAFRGVNTASPINTSAETETGAGNNPDPPSVTPGVDNCCIVIFACGFGLDTSVGTVTNYTHPTNDTITANDNNDSTVAGAYRILTGGSGVPEDPGSWNSWANMANWSVTIALEPA